MGGRGHYPSSIILGPHGMTLSSERMQMPFLVVCLADSLGNKPEREGQGGLPVGDSVGLV